MPPSDENAAESDRKRHKADDEPGDTHDRE
jgi:hypothetical protein